MARIVVSLDTLFNSKSSIMKNHVIALSLILVASFSSCNSKTDIEEAQTNSDLAAIINPSEKATETYYYVTASSGLSLRSGTNLKSKKLLVLPYGAQVKHLSSPEHTAMTLGGITGEMIEVSYQGATGFAFNGYLTTLAPPQPSETIKDYAKRISTTEHKVDVITKAHNKGEDYGMTTSIELPARDWKETYKIAQRLFNLPKNIQPDFNTKGTVTILNKEKRERTLTDELTLNVSSKGELQNLSYAYKLKNYKRTVIITKTKNGFLITEVEESK